MKKSSDDKIKKQIEKVGLEDFSLIKVIGKGTFAKVVLVKKTDSKQLYALKVIKKRKIKEKK